MRTLFLRAVGPCLAGVCLIAANLHADSADYIYTGASRRVLLDCSGSLGVEIVDYSFPLQGTSLGMRFSNCLLEAESLGRISLKSLSRWIGSVILLGLILLASGIRRSQDRQ